MKKIIAVSLLAVSSIAFLNGFIIPRDLNVDADVNKIEVSGQNESDYIKWVDFNVPATMMHRTQKAHKQLVEKSLEDAEFAKEMKGIGACELLGYLAVKNGNKFNIKKDTITLNALVKELLNGDKTKLDKYQDNKYFKRNTETFHAVLDGIIDANTGVTIAAHPIAKGYWTSGYDDFGTSRSYGYKRRHLGHDLFGSTGTPIMAVESGTISELGWNRYGGWRVGIKSECGKRYYYFAHLRKNKPYPEEMKIGDKVEAGQLIGWLGNTGYSRKPNVNMTSGKPHLHFGMQLIFHPSQEDGSGEIWIDVYQICKFLEFHKIPVKKEGIVNKP